MRNLFNLIVMGVLCVGFSVKAASPPSPEGQAAERMARYNVVWTTPSKDASGVMSTGNGDLAAGVYAIENGDLYLLLAKNDAMGFSGGNYKTGRLRLSLAPNPFVAGKPFRQTLDLPTGSIHIEADGVLSGQGRRFDLRIHTYQQQTPDINVWVKAIEELAAKPVDLAKDWKRHCQWWNNFWDRGWIIAYDRALCVVACNSFRPPALSHTPQSPLRLRVGPHCSQNIPLPKMHLPIISSSPPALFQTPPLLSHS